MTIATYDDLRKQVITWSHRDDIDVLFPTFVQLAETEMYSDNSQHKAISLRDMETIQTTTTSTGKYLSLPDGFESSRSVRLQLDYGEIRYNSPEQMRRYQYTGQPQFFTIVGNEIEFDRVPDQEYTIEIQIFTRPNDLTELQPTNSVLTKYPTVYLYGVLVQVFTWAQDDQQAIKYDNLFANAISGANVSENKGRFGPAPSMNLDGGMQP